MSSDSAKRSLKAPPQRTLLTPRIAGNNASSASPAARLAAPRLPTATRPPTVSPRLKSYDGSQVTDAGSGVVTPHSTMKRSKVGGASPDSVGGGSNISSRPRVARPKTGMSDNAPSRSPPLVRSPGIADLGQSSAKDSIDSRFFHASDVRRQEPVPKKPEPKKAPTFFYADGKEDGTATSPRPASPVLSAVSEKRSSAPWTRPDVQATTAKSPPMLSPSLVASNSSPFFPPATAPYTQLRSPSPSKENIHLSYRKGASQIFGMRPTPPQSAPSAKTAFQNSEPEQRGSVAGSVHKKSPSLSSIDSGNSHGSRRRSATAVEFASPSPLTNEVKTFPIPQSKVASPGLPSIETSITPSIIATSPPMLSPTKNAFDVAADARRERKVLDLEISNSSLLAINASLEREMRRQKAELKRFRRLSRAGRLSFGTKPMSRQASGELDPLGEEDEDEDSYDPFGLGSPDDEELSESEDEESVLGSGHLSPGAEADRQHSRLAKDERRLRVDLERHKELLTQSQAMNQSLKRCMLATEEMIRDGRKALEYSVRVSDVKLGGRILTGHEDDDIIEVEDDHEEDGGMESAKGLLDVWRGVGRPTFEGSEASVDRDSGIEVDKPLGAAGYSQRSSTSFPAEDFGRPPERPPMVPAGF